MAASPLPRQRPPVQSGSFRRSFTQPPRSLSFHEQAGLDPSDSAADILYSHPKARIIRFIPPIDAVRSVSSPVSFEYDYPVDTIETLPWRSSSEEILASGSLVIEKIRGSTNFLRSGNKPMHALMKNSQCWCVDDEATLVMRVGAFKYNRIELPYATEEDKKRVQDLKDVLKRILRFEATPCPFKRGFHVDLPESATTPRKKGPWKRKPGSLLSSPTTTTPSPLSLKKTRAPAASDNWEAQREESPRPLEMNRIEDEVEDEDGDDDEDSSGDEADLEKKEHLTEKLAGEDDSAPNETESENTRTQINGASSSITGVTVDGSSSASPVESMLKPWRGNCLESSGDRLDGPVQETAEVVVGEEGHSAESTSSDDEENGDVGSETNEQSNNRPGQVFEPIANNAPSAMMEAEAVDHLLEIEQVEAHQAVELATDPLEDENLQEGPDDNVSETHKDEMHSIVTAQPDRTLTDATAQLSDSNQKPPSHVNPVLAAGKSIPNQQHFDDIVEDPHTQAPFPQPYSQSPGAVSVSSVADSFHSVASFGSRSSDVDDNLDFAESSEPTPMAESHDPLTSLSAHHSRGTSEMTVIADDYISVSPVRPRVAASEGPSTPSLLRSSASDSSWPEAETPALLVSEEGVRQRLQTRRSLSQQPPPSTLFDSAPQSPRGSHLTGAILQKARHLALGKPIEVVVMLAHILARIAGGATFNDLMNGDLFRRPTAEDATHWRYAKPPDQPSSPRTETSEEDDYGVPIRGHSRSAAPTARRDDDDADSLFDLD